MPVQIDSNKGSIGIGDVSKLCEIPAYTIRYWEKEFKEYFSPMRTIGKQRRYCDDHIRRILQIKKLLWQDRFSIQGAKRLLKQSGNGFLPQDNTNRPPIDTHDLAVYIAKTIGDFLSNIGRETQN